jgi:glycosyltransferase involved in cell wall biosynthesis
VDGKRITFLGPCDPDTRNNLMNRAYAFLHLIEYREAFGLTTAEAMATGCPVIAYRRGSVPEVVRDGETGYIVDTIEEAINAVDRVPSLDRRTCSQWAQERFSAAQMVDGYERVYEALALAS